MISPVIISKLANYWHKENVVCDRTSIDGPLRRTELAEIWKLVGMPSQDWWLFRFSAPSGSIDAPAVSFGTVGSGWKLYYRVSENICFAKGQDGVEVFANSSFVAFMQMLTLFHEGCRKIQRECPGDSGEDWNRGDIIISQMEISMRSVDVQAFENDSNLWPYLLIDING